MGCFDGELPVIRSAAGSAPRISDAVDSLSGTVDLTGATEGMPSSRSAPRAVALQGGWRSDLRSWARDAQQYADDVSASAASYDSTGGQSANHWDDMRVNPGLKRIGRVIAGKQ